MSKTCEALYGFRMPNPHLTTFSQKIHRPKTPFKASDATWAQAGAAALQQRQKVVRGDFFGDSLVKSKLVPLNWHLEPQSLTWFT